MGYQTAQPSGTLVKWDISGQAAGQGILVGIIIPPFSPLPISLTSFTVQPQNAQTLLQWTTASEQNNDGFEVEHSTDAKNWDYLGFVPGRGTTQEEQHYSFLDPKPVKGANYYRLRQVDYDGNFEYSPVRSVLFRSGEDVAVFPTLSRGEVTVVLPEENEEATIVSIYNLQGSLVLRQEFSPQTNLLVDLSALHAGAYILEVKTGREITRHRVFRVEG